MSESTQTYGHHINGKDVFEGDIIERRNPADNDEVVARFHDGTGEIMDEAVDSAQIEHLKNGLILRHLYAARFFLMRQYCLVLLNGGKNLFGQWSMRSEKLAEAPTVKL